MISQDKEEIFSKFYIGFTLLNNAVFTPVPCQCSFHSLLKWEIKTKEMLKVLNTSALWPDEHLPFCDLLVLLLVGWHHKLDGHVLSKLRELVMDREAWHAAVHWVIKSQHDSGWTELNTSDQQSTPADTGRSFRCIQVHMEQRRQSSRGKTEILCSLNFPVQFRPILFQELHF